MHSHTQHITPHYIHNTWHHTPNSPFCYVPWIACVVLVYGWCVFCVCVVCVVCFGLWSASFACWVLWSVSSVWSLLSVVLCRVVISLVVLPLVSVVLSLLRCVSVFCASCAFWCTHQHMVIVCRVCVVCVLGSAVSRLLEHVIRNQSSGFWEEVGLLGSCVLCFCCGPRSMITYVVLMSSFHVALLSSCHVLCWWLSSCRSRHVGVV